VLSGFGKYGSFLSKIHDPPYGFSCPSSLKYYEKGRGIGFSSEAPAGKALSDFENHPKKIRCSDRNGRDYVCCSLLPNNPRPGEKGDPNGIYG
jgi:hypothetical protein